MLTTHVVNRMHHTTVVCCCFFLLSIWHKFREAMTIKEFNGTQVTYFRMAT